MSAAAALGGQLLDGGRTGWTGLCGEGGTIRQFQQIQWPDHPNRIDRHRWYNGWYIARQAKERNVQRSAKGTIELEALSRSCSTATSQRESSTTSLAFCYVFERAC
jgi:hypothetical protein